jgi:signal peptidase II
MKTAYLLLTILILIVDRVTKILALIHTATPVIANRYLTFEVVFNRGISWGMLHNATNKGFVFLSLIIALLTAFLCWHAVHMYRQGRFILGHVCIIAGSAANLIDRFLYGGVIDFILLSYGTYSWPVFNIADMAIVCGAGLLVMLDEV